MAFLHSVIGDNTKENREHLEKLGYKFINLSWDGKYIFTSKDKSEAYYANGSEFGHIDCIGNPQLFQAVSAMRDDSDYMQWFTCKVKDGLGNELPDSWVLCTQKTLQDFGWVNNSPNTYGKNTPYSKATLSELQSHFQRV